MPLLEAHSRPTVSVVTQDKGKRSIPSVESHFLPQLLLLGSAEAKACSSEVLSGDTMDPDFVVSSLQKTPASSLVDRSPLGPR